MALAASTRGTENDDLQAFLRTAIPAKRSSRVARSHVEGRETRYVRLLQRVVHPGSVAEQPVGERTQAGVVVTDDGSERSAVAASCPFEHAWLDLAGAMRVFRHLDVVRAKPRDPSRGCDRSAARVRPLLSPGPEAHCRRLRTEASAATVTTSQPALVGTVLSSRAGRTTGRHREM